MKLYFTKGLPASGKSHAVKEMQKSNPNLMLVSKDDIRQMLYPGKYNFSRAKEELVKRTERAIVREMLSAGKDVAVHNTHLAGDHELFYRSLAEGAGATFVVLDYTSVPIIDCLRRNHLREDFVNPKVIMHMAEKYLPDEYYRFISQIDDSDSLYDHLNEYKINPRYPDQDALPWCFICDVDNTLAIIGNRDPYSGDEVYKDMLNVPVADLINELVLSPMINRICILLSGREEKHRAVTEKWLKDNDVQYDYLYMRETDDTRPDSVVKRELYEKHVKGLYYCMFVIDDRNSVVKMWREELRLPVLQCNYGKF